MKAVFTTTLLATCLCLAPTRHVSAADDKKLTRANYDKIVSPIFLKDIDGSVEKLLGKSDEEEVVPDPDGNFVIHTWVGTEYTITVKFRTVQQAGDNAPLYLFNGKKSFKKTEKKPEKKKP